MTFPTPDTKNAEGTRNPEDTTGAGGATGPADRAGPAHARPAGGVGGTDADTARAHRGLRDDRATVRLRTAMAIGTSPDERLVGLLVERCAVEPDFSVREALTWALTRHSPDTVLPGLLGELGSDRAQARSQALHTLSKIGDRRAWPSVTRALLCDADDDVARSAWRAAVVLVPEDEKPELAAVLATLLGRGPHETRLSLSRALTGLGEVVLPALRAAMMDPCPQVREHATATEHLLRDPDAGFGFAIEEAKRVVALGGRDRER